jgi:hypothetical protein
MPPSCEHLTTIRLVEPRTPNGCEECLAKGLRWVHLRLCMECGHVGCCDNSQGKHATGHYRSTHHPIIRSFEPSEDWGWCYVDEMVFEELPVPDDATRRVGDKSDRNGARGYPRGCGSASPRGTRLSSMKRTKMRPSLRTTAKTRLARRKPRMIGWCVDR